MPKLFHCRTIYKVEPPSDVNPLIFEAYKGTEQSILIIGAREQQVERVQKLLQDQKFRGRTIIALGWWEFVEYGLINTDGKLDTAFLCCFDAIVVLDRDRVDEKYNELYNLVVGTITK